MDSSDAKNLCRASTRFWAALWLAWVTIITAILHTLIMAHFLITLEKMGYAR